MLLEKDATSSVCAVLGLLQAGWHGIFWSVAARFCMLWMWHTNMWSRM